MKTRVLLYSLCLFFFCYPSRAQDTRTRVNPDGTRSTVTKTGTSTIVSNSDASQSTLVNSGNTTTVMNSSGYFMTITKSANTTIFSSSAGFNGTVTKASDNVTVMNTPGGSTTITKAGNTTIISGPGATQATVIDNPGSVTIMSNAGNLTTNKVTNVITQGSNEVGYKLSFTKSTTSLKNNDGSCTNFERKNNLAVINHSDGGFASLIGNDNSLVAVNSNGLISVITVNDKTATIISSDGTMALANVNGTKTTITNSDGITYNVNRIGPINVLVNGDGKATALFDYFKPGKDIASDIGDGYTISTQNSSAGSTTSVSKIFTTDKQDITTSGNPGVNFGVNYASSPVVTTSTTATTTTTYSDSGTPSGSVNLAEKAMAGYLARPATEYAIIANESGATLSKFEIDLFSGNSKLQKAKNLIWLSITSTSVTDLADGEYVFSSKGPDERQSLKFSGSVKTAGSESKISEGSFTISKITSQQQVNIDYKFKLANGKRITGRYTGKYKANDRSANKL